MERLNKILVVEHTNQLRTRISQNITISNLEVTSYPLENLENSNHNLPTIISQTDPAIIIYEWRPNLERGSVILTRVLKIPELSDRRVLVLLEEDPTFLMFLQMNFKGLDTLMIRSIDYDYSKRQLISKIREMQDGLRLNIND